MRVRAGKTGGTPARVPPVVVLVAPDCPACDRVPDIVAQVQRLNPRIQVRVVDLASEDLPDGIPFVGTPSYVVDEQIVSFGNPDPRDLLTIIEGWTPRER